MKNCSVFVLTMLSLFVFGQQKQFDIEWTGDKLLETAYGKITVPAFDEKHFSYDEESGLMFFAQWNNNGGIVDETSVSLSNVSYETINESSLKDLNVNLIPKSLKFNFYNTNARNKRGYYFEISPIISDRGVYKRITSF
jgi:hypothetical protein